MHRLQEIKTFLRPVLQCAFWSFAPKKIGPSRKSAGVLCRERLRVKRVRVSSHVSRAASSQARCHRYPGYPTVWTAQRVSERSIAPSKRVSAALLVLPEVRRFEHQVAERATSQHWARRRANNLIGHRPGKMARHPLPAM